MKTVIKKSMKNQRGLTLISWVIVIVFLLFQVVIAMNVLPVYITDSNIAAIMENLPNDEKAKGLLPNKLKALVVKRLGINSVYNVTSDHVTVKASRGINLVTIEYEPRGKLIGNLEYIVSFKHEATVSSR